MEKHVLVPARVRTVPPQFSWIDQRLVRDGYGERCSTSALALYLFLLTVADAQGLSYYSDQRLAAYLKLDGHRLDLARRDLIAADLIAYQKPLYQVLSLQPAAAARAGVALSLGALLRQVMEKKP